MKIFHVLAGLGLIGLTVYGIVIVASETDDLDELIQVVLSLFGLLLGFSLFTGFLQLGSQHTVPDWVIYKIGGTVLGGVTVILALLGKLKRVIPDGFYYGVLVCGSGIFFVVFYWGLLL